MSIARDLYQLQEIDLALEANSQAQTRASAQLGESQTVLKARARLADEKKRLEDLNHKQKSIDWEVDDLTNKIKEIDKKLYGGKIFNSKELASLQQEADDFKKSRSGLEDKELELMDEVELAQKNIAADTEELAKLEAQWQEQQKQLTAELEQLKAKNAELTNRRQQMVEPIEAGSVSIYQELRKRKGTAVAKVERGTCQGCRIVLPNSDLQQAKGGGLVRCSSCGRIIYLA
ncbi:MAG: hypothetical protein JW856_02010 [Dehalococcoidales bacterium]|nr:hypothetical protein [Dehalococcoidales bacterium]